MLCRMNSYDKNKVDIRPILDLDLADGLKAPEEKFQNETLRPILKMQHDLIRCMVRHYFKSKKNVFSKLSLEEKPHYIKDKLLTDKMIRYQLTGMVIGMMTQDEIDYYISNQSPINKRIQSLLYQRIMSIIETKPDIDTSSNE